MAFYKLVGASEAPTVDVEIPTKNGPLQLRMPRQDFIPREQLQRVQRRMVELSEEVRAKRSEIIEDGGIVWDLDPDTQFPDDRVYLRLLFEEVFPENPEYAQAIDEVENGVVIALTSHWQKESGKPLGKSSDSSTSSRARRTSKRP